MSKKFYDIGDYCIRVSLYCTGLFFKFTNTQKDREDPWLMYNYIDHLMCEMINDCRLFNILGHRKSSIYKWSNSGSANEPENVFWKRPTYWIYNNILKRFDVDPYKGLNGDQYRALFMILYLQKSRSEYRKIAKNILWGFVLRLGMFPSLCEHALMKPQAFVLLFKMFWFLYPLYLISYIFFRVTAWSEINFVPNSKGTTNKITLLPTMYILQLKMPPKEFIHEVYKTYFHSGDEIEIGNILRYELTGEVVE